MLEYKITVKPWMLKPSSDGFDFMKQFNHDIPMPLMIMYTGGKIDETGTRIKCSLHGDIKQRITTTCMACGRPITNKISQYFGIGPVCGGHNYVSPFKTEEELDAAVSGYRAKLINTAWSGWIPLSAIKSIDDETNPVMIKKLIDNMPIEICDDDLGYAKSEVTDNTSAFPVTVRIGAPHRCTGDFSAYISSRYNKALLDRIKSIIVQNRYYDVASKIWEVDYLEFKKLRAEFENDPEHPFNFQVSGESIVPSTDKLTVDFDFKTTPMQHQIEGVQYGLEHFRYLLGDDPGVGKTKQVLDLACIRKQTMGFKHCLIICGVNSLKWNWLAEIEKHTYEQGYVLGQYMMPRRKKLAVKGNSEKLADLERIASGSDDLPYFIITNIESVRNVQIADKIQQLCSDRIFDMVAIDEAHRIRNLNTKTGEGILKIQPTYRVAMTGTPLINTPLDLYALLKWLGYQIFSFKQFKYHFCKYDEWGNLIGYKNIDQLRDQLAAIMLRRTKEEVLPYLPSKVYENEYVELTDEQKKIYNDVIEGVVNDESLATTADCILVLKLRLRQISGGIGPFNYIKKVPKLDRLEQLVEEAVYSGAKVIVYSNWVEGIEPALERLSSYSPVVITGDTKDADRKAIVDRFQNDPSVKVIAGTIGALGTGFTLSAATEVIFLDEPWTDLIKEQAIDRAHRIGTTLSVTVRTLMSYGTYDEEVHDIVLGKRELADQIIDRRDLLSWKVA